MNSFQDLIQELGEFIGTQLHANEHQACSMRVNETLNIQIELEPSEERVLLTSLIVELPPGKFRENILKDALKANFLAEEKSGFLSYLERENKLVLFEYIPFASITKDILYKHLLQFIERANQWLLAIESGKTAPESGEIPEPTDKKGPMFGFK